MQIDAMIISVFRNNCGGASYQKKAIKIETKPQLWQIVAEAKHRLDVHFLTETNVEGIKLSPHLPIHAIVTKSLDLARCDRITFCINRLPPRLRIAETKKFIWPTLRSD
jgi:hypothetical protein